MALEIHSKPKFFTINTRGTQFSMLKNHLIYICNFKLVKKFVKLNIVINSIKKPTFQTDTKNIPLSTERGIYRNENVIFIYV